MRARAFILVLMLGSASPLLAQESANAAGNQIPSIVTTGNATVRRAPDQAFVSVGVETRARTPRDAQAQNAQAMTAVQQRIAAAGIPKDAVRATGYSIQQEFDYSNGKQTPRGYVARNGIEVRVDAVEKTGDLLDTVVGGGATAISGVRFDIKDRVGAEREALRLAVADARARAEAMAAGAGRALDRILRIVDNVQPHFKPQPAMMVSRAAEAPAETPVAPGEIEVTAQVELTVAIR
ncbi:MAG: SIMPL domain-containing protein [Vicinamibacterales bacterium]